MTAFEAKKAFVLGAFYGCLLLCDSRVVVFESGDENLLINTKDLLRHAMEVQTQNGMAM